MKNCILEQFLLVPALLVTFYYRIKLGKIGFNEFIDNIATKK